MLCILWETAMTIGLRLRIRKLLVQSSDGRVVLRALVVLSLSFLIESSSLRAVGDPRLSHQIAVTQRVSFAVVHFNSGMHDWGYTDHNSSLKKKRWRTTNAKSSRH
jgi:hypothetical protein